MLFLLNCIVGVVGYEVLFLIGSRSCGERTLAAPFFIFPMGLVCGLLSIWFSWTGTILLLTVQAILVAIETWRVRSSWKV